MEFKLAYKSYEYKMSLAAMKRFKEATGRDLWSILSQYVVEYSNHKESPLLRLCGALGEFCDFETASYIFYCLAKECNSRLTIEEIQDAMFHVGWRPSERPDDMSEPYPLVLVLIASDIDQYFSELVVKKKQSLGLLQLKEK